MTFHYSSLFAYLRIILYHPTLSSPRESGFDNHVDCV